MEAAASGVIMVTAGVLRIAFHSFTVAAWNLGHSEALIWFGNISLTLLTTAAVSPVMSSSSKATKPVMLFSVSLNNSSASVGDNQIGLPELYHTASSTDPCHVASSVARPAEVSTDLLRGFPSE